MCHETEMPRGMEICAAVGDRVGMLLSCIR